MLFQKTVNIGYLGDYFNLPDLKVVSDYSPSAFFPVIFAIGIFVGYQMVKKGCPGF